MIAVDTNILVYAHRGESDYVMSMRQGWTPEWVVFRHGLTSYRELLDHTPTLEGKGANEIPYWSILPGALFSVDMMRPFYEESTDDIHPWIIDPLDKALARSTVPAEVRVTTLDEVLSSDW